MKKWRKVEIYPCGCYTKERTQPQSYSTLQRVFSPQCVEGHKPQFTQSDDDTGNYYDNFVDGRGF